MTKWSQKKPVAPKRFLHKALGGVRNGHVTKHAVKRLARKAGKLPSEGSQTVTESILRRRSKKLWIADTIQ